jgi:hypothetical protein
MNTYEDHVQYQMLLDAVNLNNNSLVILSHEYYRSCFPAYICCIYQGISGCGVPRTDQNIFAADTSNFLLGIPFAADSSHMEGFSRTNTDINWSTCGTTPANPIPGTVGTTIIKEPFATNCLFNSVCDWNLIMTSSDSPIPYQCYLTQTPLNTLYHLFHIIFDN